MKSSLNSTREMAMPAYVESSFSLFWNPDAVTEAFHHSVKRWTWPDNWSEMK